MNFNPASLYTCRTSGATVRADPPDQIRRKGMSTRFRMRIPPRIIETGPFAPKSARSPVVDYLLLFTGIPSENKKLELGPDLPEGFLAKPAGGLGDIILPDRIRQPEVGFIAVEEIVQTAPVDRARVELVKPPGRGNARLGEL